MIKNKKILMWLPFFIGMFFGNPFIKKPTLFSEENEPADSLSIFICILYHCITLIFIGHIIFFMLV